MAGEARLLIDAIHAEQCQISDAYWAEFVDALKAIVPEPLWKYIEPKIDAGRPLSFTSDIREVFMYLKIPAHSDVIVQMAREIKLHQAKAGEMTSWSVKQFLVIRALMMAHMAVSLESAIFMAREIKLQQAKAEEEGGGDDLKFDAQAAPVPKPLLN